MVYTVVLEATAARIESSSLSLGTNNGDAATMVEWPRTVNPVLKKRNRFESYHLHQSIPQ